MKIKEFFKKLKIQFGKTTIILLAVFVILLALDLILKECEVKYNWNFTVIPKFIWVQSGQQNTGAAFSSFAEYAWGKAFLIVLSTLMFLIVAAVFIFLPERFAVLKLALAMIAAGALGNLVDRIAFGYVRDFVWMWIFGSIACCNFADFFIVLGVILAIVDVLFFNEWAVLPLTKGAKERVAAREKRGEEGQTQAEETNQAETETENKEVTEIKENDGEDRTE